MQAAILGQRIKGQDLHSTRLGSLPWEKMILTLAFAVYKRLPGGTNQGSFREEHCLQVRVLRCFKAPVKRRSPLDLLSRLDGANQQSLTWSTPKRLLVRANHRGSRIEGSIYASKGCTRTQNFASKGEVLHSRALY